MYPRIITQQILQYKPTGDRDIGRLDDAGKMTPETEHAMMADLEIDDDDVDDDESKDACYGVQLKWHT
jgi:hypothetical protein